MGCSLPIPDLAQSLSGTKWETEAPRGLGIGSSHRVSDSTYFLPQKEIPPRGWELSSARWKAG